jgi:glutathione S-transferase
MPDLVLYLGNRNYSSWSLRAWLAAEQSGLPFREETIWLDEDIDRARRFAVSPAGKVPVLVHGQTTVWDSLAIAEYLAELAPAAGLWPEDPARRARARSLCAEMHSGFPAVRQNLPMNVRERIPWRDRGVDTAREIERLASMWAGARREFGAGGPFLFGRRSLVDAFYAPVAFRFRTYDVKLDGEAATWVESILDLPAMRDWAAGAEAEGHPQPQYDALL